VKGGSDSAPMVSVIIPTRDRAEDLAQSLPFVLANDYPNFEVIVVDQSTTDASRSVVMEAASGARGQGRQWEMIVAADGAEEGGERGTEINDAPSHRLVYRRTPTVGVSRSLNEGVRYARADIMAFTPDDSTVPGDWLRRATEVLEREPQAGIVFGAVVAERHDWQRTFVPSFMPTSYRRLQGVLARARLRGVMGANMIIRRAVFERVGRFDEFLGTGCRFRSAEDSDLAYRALRLGFAVVLDPRNEVLHWGTRDYTDQSAQHLIRNTRYGVGAFFAKHLRCGDPLAAYALLAEAFRGCAYFVSNVVKHRRLTGAGHLLYLMMGLMAGFRQPVDHRQRLFVPIGRARK